MNAADSSRLPPAGDPDTLYIVDVSGYVFRAYHALPPLNSPTGEPTHAVLGVTTMLQKLINEQKPALFAVAMDSRTPSFRREMYAEYKANRPPAPQDLRQQMVRVEEVVNAHKFAVLQRDGVEADDVIATAVRWALEQKLRVVIVSSDKDLMQLVGDSVWMLDGVRNAVFGPTEVQAKLMVPTHLVRDYLALVGDSSDNVPGVPSVGPKTAAALLLEHGSLEQLYAGLDRVARPALREKLAAHKEQAFLSQRLVTLRHDVDVVLDRATLQRNPPDSAKVRALFTELGFVRLLGAVPAAAPEAASVLVEASAVVALQAAVPEPPRTQLVLDAAALEQLAVALRKAERVAFTVLVEGEHLMSSHPVSLAFAWSDGAAYVPVGHAGLGRPDQLEVASVLAALKPWLEDPRPTKVSADTKREATALAGLGIKLTGVAFDCMLASYLIDPERHSHSLADIARIELNAALPDASKAWLARVVVPGSLSGEDPTRAAETMNVVLATVLRAATTLGEMLIVMQSEKLLHELELPLSFVLAQIERTGIRLDAHHLQAIGSKVAEDLTRLELKCKELAGRDFNVGAPRQIEAILFDELKLPVVKRTKTARSTDHEVLEELAALHELPAAILEHRMLAKLKSTYIDSLPKQVIAKTGRIHTDFRQAVAATGRLSSSDPNLQNIPIRSETGRLIRDAFVPEEGWLMMSADYSQIELRVLAHLSRDPELLDAFRTAADVHTRTARALFEVDDAGVTREMRGQAKTVNFAVIYGQTQFALARNLRIERARAGRYIEAFFLQYAGVKAFMERIIEEARAAGEVRTLAGRVRKLPDLASPDRVRRQAAERVARNTPIQGTAADILKLAMLGIARAIEKQGLQSRMLLTVHDEIVCEAPPAEREAIESILRTEMQNVIALEVPLVVDIGCGKTWGTAKA